MHEILLKNAKKYIKKKGREYEIIDFIKQNNDIYKGSTSPIYEDYEDEYINCEGCLIETDNRLLKKKYKRKERKYMCKRKMISEGVKGTKEQEEINAGFRGRVVNSVNSVLMKK